MKYIKEWFLYSLVIGLLDMVIQYISDGSIRPLATLVKFSANYIT